MKKNKINVRLHFVKSDHSISDGINQLHTRIIERKLNESNLTPEEKIVVIDKIMDIIRKDLNELNS